MRIILVIFLCLILNNSFAQKKTSNLIFEGVKGVVLNALKTQAQGKLSSGEIVSSGCDHGACYFQIIYNGRRVTETIGENFTSMQIYEYDFGNDGDKEIVVSVNLSHIQSNGDGGPNTTDLYVYRYAKGLLQKLFVKEIGLYKTVIRRNYIEYYMPSGLDAIWHYYQGAFYKMEYVEVK